MKPIYLEQFLLHFIIHNVNKDAINIIDIERIFDNFEISYSYYLEENGQKFYKISLIKIDSDFNIIKL